MGGAAGTGSAEDAAAAVAGGLAAAVWRREVAATGLREGMGSGGAAGA